MSRADLYRGDAEQVLAGLEPQSVHAVVTDPPYGLVRGRRGEEILRAWLAGRRPVPSGAGFAGEAWDAEMPGPSVWRAALRVVRPGGFVAAFGHQSTVDLVAVAMRLGGLEVVDHLVWLHGQGWARPHTRSLEVDEDVAAALKPAATPIVLAQVPLNGTVAETFATYGTGLLRLDRTRVGGGRHPANALFSHEPGCTDDACDPDCPVAMLDAQSGRLKARGNVNPTRSGGGSGRSGPTKAVLVDHGAGDAGGASRFFYRARPSKSERNAGLAGDQTNEHPSVKPVALMRYLIELLCPPGGVVLDPYLGSGTTAVAAAAEAGVNCIGIDRDDDGLYLPVAAVRARHAGAEVVMHDRSGRSAAAPEDAGEVTEDLRQAARRLRQAEQRVAVLRGERDALLAQGRAGGMTWRRLAETSGLSSPQAAERIVRRVGEPDA